MEQQTLKSLVEKSTDKLGVFTDPSKLDLVNFNFDELISVINEFLSDEEKRTILEAENRRKLSIYLNLTICPNKIIDKILPTISSSVVMQIIQDSNLLEKYDFSSGEIRKIIENLDDKTKIELLFNEDFVKNKLKLNEFDISIIIETLEDESMKLKMIEYYEIMSIYHIEIILTSFTSESIKSILLEGKYVWVKEDIPGLVALMDVNHIVSFLIENKDFLTQNNIYPFSIIRKLSSEEQLEFIKNMENIGLSMRRKNTNFSCVK